MLNPQQNNSEKKLPLSPKKKYALLATAASLLIGAYFFGNALNFTKSYTHSDSLNADAAPQKTVKNDDKINGDFKIFSSDQILGDMSNNPVVRLVEYGSLTCPHCAEFHENHLKIIKNDYVDTAKIQYIYRDYPLDGAALKASLLARCDISKRQAFLNLLYKKQAEWTQAKSISDIEKNLMTIGKLGGLSADKITACFTDKQLTQDILDVQKQSSVMFSIEATPTIIINNQKFSGGKTADEMKKIFDTYFVKIDKTSTTKL